MSAPGIKDIYNIVWLPYNISKAFVSIQIFFFNFILPKPTYLNAKLLY